MGTFFFVDYEPDVGSIFAIDPPFEGHRLVVLADDSFTGSWVYDIKGNQLAFCSKSDHDHACDNEEVISLIGDYKQVESPWKEDDWLDGNDDDPFYPDYSS